MLQNALLHIANSKDALLIYQDKKFTAYQLGVRSYEIIEILQKMQGENRKIAFCLPNSPELLCWHLACIHLGIAIVPIPYEAEPKYIEEVFRITEPQAFYTSPRKKRDLMEIRFPKLCKIEEIDDTYKSLYKHIEQQTHLIFNPTRDLSKVDPKALAMIAFSHDGKIKVKETLELKGIMHSYQSAHCFIELLYDVMGVRENLSSVTAQSMGHLEGIAAILFPLLKNGTVVLLEKFEIHDYLDALTEFQPSHIWLRDHEIYEIANSGSVNKKGFDRINTCFAIYKNIPIDLAQRFHEKTGAAIQFGYGMTETGIVTINRMPWLKNPGSIGQKIPFASIDLRDENEGFVRISDVGEIWIKSKASFLGYYNAAELTQKMLVNGWFRTDDLALLDKEGFYWYKGPKTFFIHKGQHSLYPQALEAVLIKFPQVKRVIVIAAPDQVEGEVPVAFVEIKEPVTTLKMDLGEIKEKLMKLCQEQLSQFQQPKEIFILEQFPLDGDGKIDMSSLKNMLKK